MQEQQSDQLEQCAEVRPARPIFVDVYAHKGKNGGIKFCHDWRLQENGPVEGDGVIEVPFGTPRSPIHFHLHDETGRELKFCEDPQDALWASVDRCPNGKGNGGQIEYPPTKAGGNKLKVDNSNSEDCELHYALRFKDKDGKIEMYDPIIRDKGGGP